MTTRRWLRRRARRVLAAAVTAAASLSPVAACGPTSPGPPPTAPASSVPASPVPRAAAMRLYADPANSLFAAAAHLAGRHPAEAAELRAIARTPSSFWAAGQPGEMQTVRQVTRAAARHHSVPVIVAYNLPRRDACGKFSAGQETSAAGYRHWIGRLAAAIGGGGDIVIVEPDGLLDILRHCLSAAQNSQRYRLLQDAMKVLGALPHARVYLDAGNPGLFEDPSVLTEPLRKAGIQYGRGFSANVANFQWTGTVIAWSQQLEGDLASTARAVIDTSRNGRGPYTGRDYPRWCNPPGRALGPAPRLDPGPAGIDAYLWIKNPGASDGPCHGGPAAGQDWPRYAAALASASRQ
jgi:endoglucanase